MEADKIIELSACEIAKLIREKSITSEEATRAFLNQIAKVNPIINAVVELNPNAIEEAKALDAKLKEGKSIGRLHGVPITLKEQLPIKGFRQTQGGIIRDHVASSDGIIWQRLKNEGAVLLGTTNEPELALSFETFNNQYGPTLNPHDPKRTAGGSSGGEASIVASKGSPLGFGTDIGGSLRIPSHFCGVSTFKPGKGKVPLSSCYYLGNVKFEDVGTFQTDMATIGPISRSIEDLELGYTIISGTDYNDSSCLSAPYNPILQPNIVVQSLRIAYFYDVATSQTPTSEGTRDAIDKTIEILRKCGVTEIKQASPPIERGLELFFRIFGRDGGDSLKKLISLGSGDITPALNMMLGATAPNRLEKLEQLEMLLVEWKMYNNAIARFFADYDIVISPVSATPAYEHGGSKEITQHCYSTSWNICGYPALVVGDVARGKGHFENLPIGVQIIAPPHAEHVLFHIGKLIEQQK